MDKHLVYNAVVCLNCGRLIESSHVHDYRECGCENESMVDGGLEYGRYGGVEMGLVHPIYVFDDEPHEKVRVVAYRRHESGPIVRLYKMSDAWLKAAYDWEINHGRNTWHTRLLEREIYHRYEKNITVEEETTKKAIEEERTRSAKEKRRERGRVETVSPDLEDEESSE